MTGSPSSPGIEHADLSPQESGEFYRLVEEVGSGRMTLPDVMRLAARRCVAQRPTEAADASIAAQLQRSMELNARMKTRLQRYRDAGASMPWILDAILKDEDPV